jgi:hypothetical protein
MRLKRPLIVLICVLLLLGLAFAAVAWQPVIAATEPPEKAAFDKALIANGAQLALIGN